jgi:tRNA modification GTPase
VNQQRMAATDPTIVAELTPPGRGAVATLLVTGLEAVMHVQALFRPASGRKLVDEPVGRIVLGRWNGDANHHGETQVGEEVVVCRIDRQRVEVHCHGGRVAASVISQSLNARGCEQRSWSQAVELQETDPIAVAARVALSAAPTLRTAAILLAQYQGALRREVNELLALLDDHNPAVTERLGALRAHRRLGSHLTAPWQVVLAGRPNVGKSSLINALLGYERAIVDATPGTTRDVLTATAAIDGWPVELSDTAGLRSSGDPIESLGVERARERQAGADLVLLVFDATAVWTAEDEALLHAHPTALLVLNKVDLLPIDSPRHAALRGALPVSARTQFGFDAMTTTIAGRLVPGPMPLAIPFTPDQWSSLDQVASLIEVDQFAAAANLLRSSPAWRTRSQGPEHTREGDS